MSEICPLRSGELGISDVCRDQCQGLWDQVLSNSTEKYDVYGSLYIDPCSTHEVGDLEHSHEGLQVGPNGTRIYASVDVCADCGQEYGEQTATFYCPYA